MHLADTLIQSYLQCFKGKHIISTCIS